MAQTGGAYTGKDTLETITVGGYKGEMVLAPFQLRGEEPEPRQEIQTKEKPRWLTCGEGLFSTVGSGECL